MANLLLEEFQMWFNESKVKCALWLNLSIVQAQQIWKH